MQSFQFCRLVPQAKFLDSGGFLNVTEIIACSMMLLQLFLILSWKVEFYVQHFRFHLELAPGTAQVQLWQVVFQLQRFLAHITILPLWFGFKKFFNFDSSYCLMDIFTMRINAIFVIPLLTLLLSRLGRFSDFNKLLNSGTNPGKAGYGDVHGFEKSFWRKICWMSSRDCKDLFRILVDIINRLKFPSL